MAELNRESNTSLVMVTHDRDVALQASHIYELVDGRICKYLEVAKTGRSEAAKAIEDRSCTFK